MVGSRRRRSARRGELDPLGSSMRAGCVEEQPRVVVFVHGTPDGIAAEDDHTVTSTVINSARIRSGIRWRSCGRKPGPRLSQNGLRKHAGENESCQAKYLLRVIHRSSPLASIPSWNSGNSCLVLSFASWLS